MTGTEGAASLTSGSLNPHPSVRSTRLLAAVVVAEAAKHPLGCLPNRSKLPLVVVAEEGEDPTGHSLGALLWVALSFCRSNRTSHSTHDTRDLALLRIGDFLDQEGGCPY